MEANMAGDDASLDAAVAAITKKVMGDDIGVPDKRENRTDRDATERDDYTDLDALEAAERMAKAEGEEPAQGDTEGEEGQEASAEDDAFIELPASEEGKAPERVPVSEAVQAVQKLRQMQGDIDTAVIRAEEEAISKHDRITQALTSTFEQVAQQAKVALQMMHNYAPPPPDPVLLDRNAGYYDPEHYHTAKIQYDNFVKHYNDVLGTLKQAEQGQKLVGGQQETEHARRETERASRYIPEFKDPATREARKAFILEHLQPYGVTKQELDEIVGHREWRMMNDLANLKAAERKAPEVRKQVQEKAPKLVRGRLPEREKTTGRFVNEARKALREQGSEESLANWLLKSGALNGL